MTRRKMTERKMPRYPVYIPTKGRVDASLTARSMDEDGCPFWLVVEPAEADAYAAKFGRERILVLPENDFGLLRARNWIMDHSLAAGAARHWQFDDNIRGMQRRYKAMRLYCNWVPAIRILEDFTDRYENVGISGFNYAAFCKDKHNIAPYFLNCHVYSASLILNDMPHRWRLRYNDDTDMCLQVLAGGLCTVLFNAFLVLKMRTMTVKGGNTDDLYQGDGRLTMARTLERAWPHVVSVDRRFLRPQHKIRAEWKKFDTTLKRRTDIDWDALPKIDDYGLELQQTTAEVRSPMLRQMLGEQELKK